MESESLSIVSCVPDSVDPNEFHDTASDLDATTIHVGQKCEEGFVKGEEKERVAAKGKAKMVDKGFQFPDLANVVHKVTPDLKVKPCPGAVFVDGSWVVPDSADPYESETSSDDLAYDPADHWTPKFRDAFDEIIMTFLPAWNPSMRRKRKRSEK